MDHDRDPDDLDLRRPDDPDADEPELGPGPGEPTLVEAPRERRPWGLAALVLLMLVAVVPLLLFLTRRPPAPAPPASAAPSPSASPSAPPATPAPALPEAIMLPALDQSDALVRELVGRLSAHPQVAAWLSADQLVRRFVVLVVNVADAENPRPNLRFLEPRQRLGVLQRGTATVIDPASYARFDGFAGGLESLDEAGCAQVHRLLSPLLEAAFRELGHPEGGFDRALAAGARALLEVPVLEGDVSLRPVLRARLVYEYADPRLEALSLPQKQLLRMGPGNVRRLQAKLRALAAALGLPLAAGPVP
jgi:hypothetical protein